MQKNILKNTNFGFVNLNIILFFTIFLSLYFTISIAISLSEKKDSVRTICYESSIELQSHALTAHRKLFNLNSVSTGLRISIQTTQASIAAATAALQFELIPPLERMLDTLYKSQKVLDKTQKTLIQTTINYIKLKQAETVFKMNKSSQTQNNTWAFLLDSFSNARINNKIDIPVQPDSIGGIGPNYEWKPNAEELLTVSYIWSSFFKTNERYQHYLNWGNKYSFICGIKPQLKGKEWELKTIVDKF